MFQLLTFVVLLIGLNGILLVTSEDCSASFSVRYPFRLDSGDRVLVSNRGYNRGYIQSSDDESRDEGYPGLVLNCSYSRLVINISNHLYLVRDIDYNSNRVTIVDLDISEQDCPQPRTNVSLQSTPSLNYYDRNPQTGQSVFFYNCSNNTDTQNVQQSLPCLDDNNNNTNLRSYAFMGNLMPKGFNGYTTCLERVVVPFSQRNYFGNTSDLNFIAKQGFQLYWSTPTECHGCESSGGKCQYNSTGFYGCRCLIAGKLYQRNCSTGSGSSFGLYAGSGSSFGLYSGSGSGSGSGLTITRKVIIGVSTGVGVVLLILLVLYRKIISSRLATSTRKVIIGVSTRVGGVVLPILLVLYRKIISSLCTCWRNKTQSSTNVEVFLKNCGCLGLQSYTYSEVKKITNSFKDTLGKGGYGCVFKGQLRDGRLVAVKVLNESKGNGEDFVNEVATIGRTNHVNVVSLLGFCIERAKRALVYEFMPNGSLERFIYTENESSFTPPLGSEKLYQIALGIARGLEYLHRGCNTRILHFDIKPHNILLDKDFCPKISDFGMAKLCPTRDVSVVSLVGARGTIGYIAPEVCCRNFGGVSHKSDVYSYGMMVFEMIGRRKNINAKVENMSEIYFPQWVYNHLKPDFSIEGSCEMFEEETTKKMIVVALWCIQTHPTDRPSMTKVLEMLEGNNEELEIPPDPFLRLPSQSSTSSP